MSFSHYETRNERLMAVPWRIEISIFLDEWLQYYDTVHDANATPR